MDKTERPAWDEYFMGIAQAVSARSTCIRRQVGCVLVKDKRILSTGYNGAPSGCDHCDEKGCVRQAENIPSGQRHELCRGSHAEMNAIAQAAKNGTAIDGCTCYCTLTPCSICAKLLINAGCKRIVAKDGEYPDPMSAELLDESGIRVEIN